MTSLPSLARRGAEAVGSSLFVVMLAAFLIQIFMRYVVREPVGWTVEVCMTAFIWITFWANAFLVREREHVTFTIVYDAAPPRVRRVLAVLSALSIGAAFLVAVWPTWSFVDFMARMRTDALRVPFKWVFLIFVVFLVVVGLRSLLRALSLGRAGWRERL